MQRLNRRRFFDYKLVVLSTLPGIPLVYALVPAHTDEREAAEAVVRAIAKQHT
ncbi:MAG: hypothetical protein AAGD25_37525 [Cyanobacteria bacterium P01_F01_bin.150]